jgi:hypothetical protein
MRASSSLVSMPRRNRLNTNGNGPNAFSRDSPVWRMVHWSDEIGEVGSATEAEMGRRVGSGAPFIQDSGLDLPPRTGSRPWMGGDDTILTPFSLSPTTDVAVDSLPALFLAYCMLADSNDVLSIDDRVAPRGSGSDPVPLLTDCTFGLGPSFLSRSRRWPTYLWCTIPRPSASNVFPPLSPPVMTHLWCTTINRQGIDYEKP